MNYVIDFYKGRWNVRCGLGLGRPVIRRAWSDQCVDSSDLGKMDGMALLPASVPHSSAAVLRSWTLDGFQGLRGLRAALRDTVAETSGPDLGEVLDRMSVVVTELATNALRHGLPPTVVRLLRAGNRLIIDVADHDLAAAPRVDEDRPLGAGGLGLRFTRTFAIDVGWYATDGAKHVWASFPS